MEIGLALCPAWKQRSLKNLESRRITIIKDAGETGEVYHQLKAADEAMAAVGMYVVMAEDKAAGNTMDRYSMECTAKTSYDDFTQARWNIWAPK